MATDVIFVLSNLQKEKCLLKMLTTRNTDYRVTATEMYDSHVKDREITNSFKQGIY